MMHQCSAGTPMVNHHAKIMKSNLEASCCPKRVKDGTGGGGGVWDEGEDGGITTQHPARGVGGEARAMAHRL